MITLIFGNKGTGKTALNTHFALETMADYSRYINARDNVTSLQYSGINIPDIPLEHIVYGSYTITDRFGHKSYDVDPTKMALPNYYIPYNRYFPYSYFVIMEGQMFWNSRKKLNKYSAGFFENSRHYGLDICIDTQRPMLIDSSIREIVDRFIIIKSMKNIVDKNNNIIETRWKCIEWYSWIDCKKYVDNGELCNTVETEYRHIGNIFSSYDSYENNHLYTDNSIADEYVTEIEDKNFEIPDGYYV